MTLAISLIAASVYLVMIGLVSGFAYRRAKETSNDPDEAIMAMFGIFWPVTLLIFWLVLKPCWWAQKAPKAKETEADLPKAQVHK